MKNYEKIFEQVGRIEANEIMSGLIRDLDPKDESDTRFQNTIEYLWQQCSLMLFREGERLDDMIDVLKDIEEFSDNLDEDE